MTLMTEALPSIESSGGRAFWFEASDGARLRGAAWDAEDGTRAGTALLLNGRTEFIEKTLEPVAELRRRGYAVWTLDWRGQGLSQRPLPNRHKGHVGDFGEYLDDLARFLDSHLEPGLKPPLVMLGHSMGGHIGLRFLRDRPGRFAAAAFSAPMIDIAVPRQARPLLRSLAWAGGKTPLATRYLPGHGDQRRADQRFEDNPLTSDRARFDRVRAQVAANPDLALGGPTLGWLNAAHASIATLTEPAYAAAIETPVLIVTAGDERIVDSAAQRRLAGLLPNGRIETLPGARHELLIEADRHRTAFWRHVDAFLPR